MKIELSPDELTISALTEQIQYFSLITKSIPEYIDMSIEQYRKFEYIISKGEEKYLTFRGIPIRVQGVGIK